MNRKKEIERAYLMAFLRQDRWQRHRIIAGDREQPDFLLDAGHEVIGVEVTNLYKDQEPRGGSPVKKAEHRHSTFLRQLIGTYYAQGGAPLHVQVLTQYELDLTTIPHLASRLRARRPGKVLGRTEFEARVGVQRRAKFFLQALPDEMDRYSRWEYVSDSIGWSRLLTPQMLEGCILGKAARLGEYRKAADRTMLLIVANRLKNSGMFHFQPTGTLLEAHGFLEVHLFLYPEVSYRVA